METMEATEAYLPPPLPPPFLCEDDLKQLMEQGHVPVKLPGKLEALCSSLDQSTQDFFRHDTATKQSAYPAAQSTELGYYVVEGEKEYVTLRSHTTSPARSEQALEQQQQLETVRSELERPAGQVWQQAATLMYRVLMQISQALGVPAHAWEPVLDGCLALPADLAQATPSLLRLFRYEPDRGIAGRHTDNGLLTLCVGTDKGLQVWSGGAWADAAGATLLAGSTLQILSSARVTAGTHQVVANGAGRRSIVFALRPSTRHTLDLAPFGGTGAWDTAALWKTITTSRVNVNATPALREKQQRERQARLDRRAKDRHDD